MSWPRSTSSSRPQESATPTCRRSTAERHGVGGRVLRLSDDEVRILALEHVAILREDGLRDRDELQRRLDVAGALDAATSKRHRHVLLALEVLVGYLGVHRHLDFRLP